MYVIKIQQGYLVCEPNLKFKAVENPDDATQFYNFIQAASTANLAQRLTSKSVEIVVRAPKRT